MRVRAPAVHTLAIVLLCVLALCTSACSPATTPARGADPLSGLRATVPAAPPAPDLATPESAVRAYLAWTNYVYVTGKSDEASAAVDPYELVHVDSYIEYNRENGAKRIYQVLEDFRVTGTSTEGTHTLVAATERWRYRYFSLKDGTWVSPVHETSYLTTYTVLPLDSRFIVGAVDASATTPVY